jgi:crotonobetainyl-CoA:carnitine CoA-transferase CaiB-like acyl-CoA transferase
MAGFFKKIKVLELASVLAGPSVGQFFAELGAEVIKVENLAGAGDVTRSWKASGETTDDRSAYFCSVNWGKRSIALDLLTQQGRDIVLKLANTSDVVVASYKPGDAMKLGVDYESLSSANPRLIYGQITGYGSNNQRVGYDAVLQAETGFMYMNGEPGGNSLKMPVALIDVLAGHQLKEALLIALLELQQTGKGRLVEVSLLDSAIASLVNQATNYLMNGKIPQKHGSAHPNIAPYGDVFVTKDGVEMILAVGSDRQFSSLCTLLNNPQTALDPRFSTNPERVRNRSDLKREIQDRISNISASDLMGRLHTLNIPAGLIRNLKDVFDSEDVASLVFKDNSLRGVRTYVGRTGSEEENELLRPPHLGEHTDEILREIGM